MLPKFVLHLGAVPAGVGLVIIDSEPLLGELVAVISKDLDVILSPKKCDINNLSCSTLCCQFLLEDPDVVLHDGATIGQLGPVGLVGLEGLMVEVLVHATSLIRENIIPISKSTLQQKKYTYMWVYMV